MGIAEINTRALDPELLAKRDAQLAEIVAMAPTILTVIESAQELLDKYGVQQAFEFMVETHVSVSPVLMLYPQVARAMAQLALFIGAIAVKAE